MSIVRYLCCWLLLISSQNHVYSYGHPLCLCYTISDSLCIFFHSGWKRVANHEIWDIILFSHSPTLPSVQFLSLVLYFDYLLCASLLCHSATFFHSLSITWMIGELRRQAVIGNILTVQLDRSICNDLRDGPYTQSFYINPDMSLNCLKLKVFHPLPLSFYTADCSWLRKAGNVTIMS